MSSSQIGPRRRFLAPEVIQTSAMDCGPAALKCLLAGHGVSVSYGRLREACQTSVDGTSIDTLETLAQTLGLDAEQVMLPIDHLLLPEADALPAIVVVRLPSGLTHFVVVWSVHGPLVQVMDPARGRRWVPRATFLRDVFRHRQVVPAGAFAEWAGGEGFTRPLARRLGALGVAAEGPIAAAVAAGGWRPMAALDAAARTVEALAASGAVARGPEASRLVEAMAAAPPVAGDTPYLLATPAPAADDGTEQVAVRGAVLLHISGARALGSDERAELPPELRAAVGERPPRVVRQLFGLLPRRPLLLAAALVLAGLGAAAEGLLFRTVIDAPGARAGWLARLLALLAGLVALEWPLARGLRRVGAGLDQALRALYLRKIPRLPDRYFQTRPVSDMAERAHLLHRLRALPGLAGDVARITVEIAAIAAGLCVIDAGDAGWVLSLAAAVVLIPLLAYPAIAERDLRMRNHAGALGRFYLDGLLGLMAVRTHRAESALAREHGVRLAEWRRAARGALAAALTGEAAQSLVGFGLAIALLLRFFGRTESGAAGGLGDLGTTLLVVYWVLSLPALGQELAAAAQQLPAQRNLTLRLLEPLDAPDETSDGSAGDLFAGEGGLAIEMQDVRVVAGGHEVLAVGGLSIGAGEQVAIVGPSGAGKSSLVGLLLGWHRPATGSLRAGGHPIEGTAVPALRQRIAWVDPSVYLWNRSLAQNLTFGAGDAVDLTAVIDGADLREVVQRLPAGPETPLGEAGGLVSGGEGQRVRLGRALARPAPRLVILDEPFRGLPRDRRAALLARARAHWAGATLLCVTHDIGDTADFPRVLVVEGGQIVEDGAPDALRARPGSRYAALFDAERRVRQTVWAKLPWRRWRVEEGRVVEDA
ncbi:MAG TPA: cysteine peptidase family C39 domain-containing protein [Polyangia bacterium]|nr:cysteine peptidase family C39 domain-containing protein [Polyangia bacterium]